MSVISYYTSSQLTVSGTSATCTSTGKGAASTTTKITVNQVLQKQSASGSWSAAKSWTKTENSYQVTAVNTTSGLSSGTYRLKTTFTFYNGTATETVVKYSGTKTICSRASFYCVKHNSAGEV